MKLRYLNYITDIWQVIYQREAIGWSHSPGSTTPVSGRTHHITSLSNHCDKARPNINFICLPAWDQSQWSKYKIWSPGSLRWSGALHCHKIRGSQT